AIIKADPLKNPGDTRSFTAMKTNIGNAKLLGLPTDFDINASKLEISINSASGAKPGGVLQTAALNWKTMVDLGAAAPADGAFAGLADQVVVKGAALNGSQDVIIDFTVTRLAVGGTLTLNAFGFVTATADFEMVRQTVDADVNADGTFDTASGDLDD